MAAKEDGTVNRCSAALQILNKLCKSVFFTLLFVSVCVSVRDEEGKKRRKRQTDRKREGITNIEYREVGAYSSAKAGCTRESPKEVTDQQN